MIIKIRRNQKNVILVMTIIGYTIVVSTNMSGKTLIKRNLKLSPI